jgi:uncharacterized protein (DUF1697 family)
VKTWVALLRGVNVGGNNMVPMKDLRAALEATGAERVRTYLQSGNAVFDSAHAKEADAATAVEACIKDTFGLDIRVVVRTAEELAKVIDRNPFPDKVDVEPRYVAVNFFRDAPESLPLVPDNALEELHLEGRHLYVWHPEGQGRSKLDHRFWNKFPKTTVLTNRNWRSVLALRDLAES